MIKIVADNFVQEDAVQTFIELAAELVKKSRKEEGNISYSLYEDLSDPSHLTFVEEWKDSDAIRAHNASEHFTKIFPKLGALCVQESIINTYKEVTFPFSLIS